MKNYKSIWLPALCAGLLLAGPLRAQTPATAEAGNRPVSLDRSVPCTLPPYPDEALMRNEEGRVVVGLYVGTDGKVEETRIDTSSGSASLDKATQETFSRCQFNPAMQNGQAVKVWAALPVSWKLPVENKIISNAVFDKRDQSSKCKMPVYPDASIRLGESGAVLFNILIGVDGYAKEMIVGMSSGFPRLDLAAQSALRKCRYKPPENGSGPIESWQMLTYVFRLPDDQDILLIPIRCSRPPYPMEALQQREEGQVELSIKVSPDGRVQDARIDISSGKTNLDKAAQTHLKNCLFKLQPVTKQDVWKRYIVQWKLPVS